MFLIARLFMIVLFCFVFPLSIMSAVFFKEFVFAFTIPFTFSEIMKALLLVEQLSRAGFQILINRNSEPMQGFSLHLALQDFICVVLPFLSLFALFNFHF